MYKSFIPYLQHIYDECVYIRSVITDAMEIDEFLADETLKRAVTRSLTIIGEATKKIPGDVKYAWQSISWRDMAGMRDKLVHDYMGVNYFIVWDVAKNIIPTLIIQIQDILKSYENANTASVWNWHRHPAPAPEYRQNEFMVYATIRQHQDAGSEQSSQTNGELNGGEMAN